MKSKAPTAVNQREVNTKSVPRLTYSRVSRVGRSYTPRAPKK